ncbi:MAG: hypothetical protein CMJ65_07400 [Planctomycetaceae bacterium]|nr:hypothetical protein [Planctomycetaceae bacterium]
MKLAKALASAALTTAIAAETVLAQGVPRLSSAPKPRGDVRIVYTSDHANIGNYLMTSSPTAEELRRVIDVHAGSGIDIFAQTVFQKHGVGWFWPEHPDHEHWSGLNAAFDKIGKPGNPPLKIAIDQSHKRGMKFLATFRMADRHSGPGKGLANRKDLQIPGVRDGGMDYTHAEVRDWVFGLVDEILRRFDVDGLEFDYCRWMHVFPRSTARKNHPIMTQLLRRVRQRLDAESKKRGRRLMLGTRVPQTLAECGALGYDIATWVREGLVDYIAPSDFFFTNFNARFEEFAALTRSSHCMLFPTVHPKTCWQDQDHFMSPENYRAAARNLYAAGADGISLFNYMYHWVGRSLDYPPGPAMYPLALAWLREFRDPWRHGERPRHYLFYPLYAGHWNGISPGGVPDVFDPTFIKNDRIVLKRQVGSSGEYRFRVCEELRQPGSLAEMVVTIPGIAGADKQAPPRIQRNGSFKPPAKDKLAFYVNGTVVTPRTIKVSWPSRGRSKQYGRPFQTCSIFMFPLTGLPTVFGDNVLKARVVAIDEQRKGPIIIDQLEVTVVPPWKRSMK